MVHVEKCTTLNILLLVVLLVHKVTSTTYYVIPDDYSSHHTDTNTFTLQHYLNNTSKYFVSHNQFHFKQGEYYINSDLIIKDVNNFTITGNGQCTIICTSPASIVVMNAISIKFHYINLINCIKNHKNHFNTSYFDVYYAKLLIPFSKVADYYTSLLLWNSSTVIIYKININVTVSTSFTAILIVNAKDDSTMIDVKVQINSFNCTAFNNHPAEINGLKVIVHFYDQISKYGSLTIDNFYSSNYKPCEHNLHCVIVAMLLRNDRHDKMNNFTLTILNSVFSDLINSSILCIYGETVEISRNTAKEVSRRYIKIQNSTFSDNSGNPNLNMFTIELKCSGQYSGPPSYMKSLLQLHNYFIEFDKCTFKRNTNMKALIYVRPPSMQLISGYIRINSSTFSENKNMSFIKVELEFLIIYFKIINVSLSFVIVSSNEYHHNIIDNLISVVNGLIYIMSVIFSQNGFYDNMVYLYSSMLYIQNYNEINSSHGRHIIEAQSNSFLYIHYLATVNISHNVVYKVIKFVSTFERHALSICPLQIYGSNKTLHLDAISCILLLSNNTKMISKTLPTEITTHVNNKCHWLRGTILQRINVSLSNVYQKIIRRVNNTVVNNTKRLIPLSVCPCLRNNSYNCYMANVYAVYPGQVLHINLMISPRWSELYSTITAANTKDDDCNILDSDQLSQTHPNNVCNRYSNTIWPNSEFITECKLFIGLNEMPEMFYVQIKHCPMGFTLQSDKKACYCDPLLRNDEVSITSCKINDETILRPANSWISAVTVNNSHSYNVSSQCPFDYCLPYSSYLNLSNPDSQCQFKRSGVVCGQCQQG